DSRHAGEPCGRRDVGIHVHLEQPWPPRLVDAEIATTVSLATDHIPCSASNADNLAGKVLRKIGGTISLGAEILIAPRFPFGAIGNDVPHSLRHLTEVDLRDR